MLRTFTNLPITAKIFILCFLPMVALLYTGGSRLVYEWQKASEAEFVEHIVEIAPRISALVHELQKERGMSAGFIGSQGSAFADTIGSQRIATNGALETFQASIDPPSGRLNAEDYIYSYENAFKELARLNAMRGTVDQLGMTVPEMAGFYTPLIRDLLHLVEGMVKVVDDGRAKRPLLAYVSILEAKERAGVERAMGAAGFGSGEFNQGVYRNFVRLGAMQDTYFETFRIYASRQDIAFFDEQLSGPTQLDYEELRDLAYGAPYGADISGVTGPQWFGISTKRIDALKVVEDRLATSIEATGHQLAAEGNTALWALITILVTMIGATAVVSFFVARSITVPLKRLANTMQKLSHNDFSCEITDIDRKDEIGEMAEAVDVLKINSQQRIELEKQSQNERDRERQRQTYVSALVDEFRQSMASTADAVSNQTEEMRHSAARLTDIAQSASSDANSAGNASEGASQNVQTVAAATEELSASISEITSQTSRAADLMTAAADTAKSTDEDVSTLSEAAERIGEVVGLIREIAEQTNLLALNATIEAARAGDAGKGFAVVASEVKTLASQTAKATEEIASQISGIQNSTRGAVEAIRRITGAVTDIRELTASIAESVSQQQIATQEIAESVQAASTGTAVVAENVQSVKGSIDRTSSEADAVNGVSSYLRQATSEMQSEVDKFLTNVSQDVEERRSALRTKMREAVVISQAGMRIKTNVLDGSRTGARIEAVEGLEVGSQIAIELADGRTMAATVVRDDGEALGVHFETPVDSVDDLVAA